MNRRFIPLIALWCLLQAAPAYGQNAGQLIALSVQKIDAGSPSFSLRVMGGNFVQGSVVVWGTRMLSTSFLDAGDLAATVTSDLLAISGQNQITVQNPNGPVSGIAYVYVEPVLYSVTPNSVPAGSSSQTLTVTGAGFDTADTVVVSLIGASGSLPTTYVSSNTLTAVAPASALAHTANATVLVVETGCCTSSPVFLKIGNPPIIGALAPASVAVGTQGFFLTVSGSNFQNGATVYWNGGAVTTTYVNSSQLTAQIPASGALSQLNSVQAYVLNPDGGTSNAATVSVVSPGPVISGLIPASATAGLGDFTLTVNGTGFVAGAKVLWNGSALATTFGSSTQLTAAVPAALTVTPGSAQITVQNPAGSSTFATSVAATLSFPGPQISILAPSTIGAGSSAFTLAVGGSGFLSTSTVLWGGLPLATTFAGATQLNAAVPASLILTPAAVNISVSNSGTPSNTAQFTVAAPNISTMDPSSASAGTNGLQILISGTGYTPTSQVQWNGTLLPIVFFATTQLTASIPPNLLTAPGKVAVAVVNPGGTASNSMTFTVNAPVISQVTPASAPVGTAGVNLSVNGSGFAGGSQVEWNNTPLVSNLINAGQINAKVPASLLAVAGNVSISVLSPGGATSNAVSFSVTSGALAISTLSPASAVAGGTAFVLTVNGSGFPADSVVQWSGAPLSTTYVSASQLSAAVPAVLVATAGSANIMVVSAAGSSNTVAFPIGAAVVVNAASNLPSIAPGSLISIYGGNLDTSGGTAAIVPLPTLLGTTSVTINGVAAPLLFAGPGQINAQVPFETQTGTATLVVTSAGVTSATASFAVTATGPGIFVVQNYADGSLNSSQRPVPAGQYAVVYMTGQGAVDHAVPTGAAAGESPLSNALAQVAATIGGQNAPVLFAGLAPGLVGVLQVDLQIPAVSTGDQPLIVTIGGVASNTIPVSVK